MAHAFRSRAAATSSHRRPILWISLYPSSFISPRCVHYLVYTRHLLFESRPTSSSRTSLGRFRLREALHPLSLVPYYGGWRRARRSSGDLVS
jgi:hypothetical protein